MFKGLLVAQPWLKRVKPSKRAKSKLLNMYVVEVPERASQEELMKKLSERKEVEYVEPDRIYRIW